MMSRQSAMVALLAAGALMLSACGGDDDSAAAPDAAGGREAGGGALTVIAQDISFPSATYQAGSGTIDVVYENEGSIEHTLVIEDVDDFKLTVSSNGDVDEGTVELDAGTYTIYCDVAGHRAAGMEATLEVS